MAFTIYTISDPATVGSVMTSMAMFFGQDDWVGTLIKLGLIISLLVILAKGVLAREGLRLDVLLLQLVAIWVMFIPTTTVTIEQFDNNAPVRVVDDVPYAIALPGAVAGAFALYMTNKIETVMSGVDGKYIKPSGEIDPFAPAKALMRIATAPLDPARHVDINLIQTLHNAAAVCGDEKLPSVKFEHEKDGFKKFADSLTKDGIVVIYNDQFPYADSIGAGELVTCDVARGEIMNVSSQLAANNLASFDKTLNGIAETTMGTRYSDNSVGTTNTNTWDDLLPILNRVGPAKAQLDSLAVANVMSYSVLSQMARNSKTALDEVMEIQRDTGLFQWAKDESMQALMVSATAPKFMDILFFIFIAATPIVMFVVVANPAQGIKVAGAYVMFGLWTQSWIPMMAIISGWYQAEIKNFSSPGVYGLTPEYLSALMRHVSTSTIAASNMLQSAPYMMFAIMTGSMFAMSSMVSKAAPSAAATGGGAGGAAAGGSGGGKAGLLGGGLVESGTHSAAQLQSFQQADALRSGRAGIGGTHPGGDVNAEMPGFGTMNGGGDISAISSAARETSAGLRKGLETQQGKALKDLANLVTSSASSLSGESMAKVARAAGFDAVYNSGTKTMAVNGQNLNFSKEHASQSAAKVAGMVAARIGTPEFLKSISPVNLAAQLAAELVKTASDTAKVAQGSKGEVSVASDSGGGVNTRNGKAAEDGIGGKSGNQYQEQASRATEIGNTFQKLAKQSESLDKADKLNELGSASNVAGTSSSIKFGDIANAWGRKGAPSNTAQEALKRVEGAIGGELGSRLGGAIAQSQNQMLKEGKLGTLSHDQIAAVAALKALDAMNHGGKPADSLNALQGMNALAVASGVGDMSPALQQTARALALTDAVQQSVDAMDAKVTPVVDAAVAKAGEELAKEPALQQAVTDKLNADKTAAGEIYNKAQSGVAAVKAQGDVERYKQDATGIVPQMRQATDPTQAFVDLEKEKSQRPVIPNQGSAEYRAGVSPQAADALKRDNENKQIADLSQPLNANVDQLYGSHQERVMARVAAANEERAKNGQPLLSTNPKDYPAAEPGQPAKLHGDPGRYGGSDQPPAQPTGDGSLIGGVLKAGEAAASGVTGMLGGVAGVGTTAATPVTGGSGAGASALPTLGNFQGPNLAPAAGGGATPQPAQPAGAPSSAKPNSGQPKGDGGAGKGRVQGRS